LASDSRHREDRNNLALGNEDTAQTHKNTYEQNQRADCKMRTEAKARRDAGGRKLI
jgi:hypothetical protein